MSLSSALAREVPEQIRVKGNRYFLGGAVRSIEGTGSYVTAIVRGTRFYRVDLDRSDGEIRGSCECPYFVDGNGTCKHIWAVIVAADAEGLLRSGSAPDGGDLYLVLDRPGGWGREHDAIGRQGERSPAASLQPWELFLRKVQERDRLRAVHGPARRLHGDILYTIGGEESLGTIVPVVQVLRRVRKKSGVLGRPRPVAISPAELETLRENTDREVLALLHGAAEPPPGGYAGPRGSFRLAGPLIDRIITLLVGSGRCYLRRADDGVTRRAQAAEVTDEASGPPAAGSDLGLALRLDDGPEWTFRLDVSMVDAQQVRVEGEVVRGSERRALAEVDALLAPEFLASRGAVGRFAPGPALPWVLELRRSGPLIVPQDALPGLVEEMARSGLDPAGLPEPLRYDVLSTTPKPRVRIARASRKPGQAVRHDLEAIVEFDYDGTVVPAGSVPAAYDGARRRMIRRDRAVEDAAIEKLQGLGFSRPWHHTSREDTLAIAVDRFPAVVRTLVQEGWCVEAEGRVIRPAAGVRMRVQSGVDWFELHGQVDFGEGRSASIAELLAALRKGEATVLLDDGTRGMIPEEWLRRYARLASFGEEAGDHVRYSTAQAAILDALLESQPSVDVDETFARARAELASFDRIAPADPPPSFRGSLRDYQREALGWFGYLRQFGFGGCLADDMGLGKTVMVLALLEARRRARTAGGPRASLVVVPRSLVFNWKAEAASFAPKLKVLDYTGEGRGAARFEDYDVVLTTYGTLRRDAARLSTHEFDYVVLDEAQAIKNPSTASARSARLLRGRHRLALSGTPVENHLGELWSLFEFLNPGFLGPSAAFSRGVAGAGRADGLDFGILSRALKPFVLRRTKEQVAPELPERVEQTIHCELEPSERRLYDELRAHYRDTLLARIARSGLHGARMHVLEGLLRLRQAALHPALVDPRREGDTSAKFELLLERLREVIDEGHKALVFSQFTSLLALLRPRLEGEGITYEYLDGRTIDRAARVTRFEADPACPVFLISLKAGGVGLNLTAADYVFLLDPWWNPAVEAQAIDRAHRIGQTRHVFAYRLIARDTVEEKIAELQRSKRDLADAIFAEDAGLISSLRPEDLEWLLS